MTDRLPTTLPTRQAAAIPGRSARNKVTGKLKTALDLMAWSGLCRAEAAEKADLADSSLRFALRKPHVLQHYNAELAALRTSLRAKNVHRLDTIADDSKNDMARVAAVKALETIADQADEKQRPGAAILPGLQIVIVNGTTAPKVIGPAPLPAISHGETRAGRELRRGRGEGFARAPEELKQASAHKRDN